VAWSRDEQLLIAAGVLIGRGSYLNPLYASTRAALAEELDAPIHDHETRVDEANPLIGLS
jgi:hypothetical protein